MHALHTCVPHTHAHTPIHLQCSFYLCDNSKITANHCDTIAQTIKCILKRRIKLVTLFNIFVYRISYIVFCYFYFHLEQIFNNLPIGSCVAEWSEDHYIHLHNQRCIFPASVSVNLNEYVCVCGLSINK